MEAGDDVLVLDTRPLAGGQGTGEPHRTAGGLLSSVRYLPAPAGYAGEPVFGGEIRPGEVRG